MILQNDIELANTREKLREIESWRDEMAADDGKDEYAKTLTLRSYDRVIAQLRDQISDYERRSAILTHKTSN